MDDAEICGLLDATTDLDDVDQMQALEPAILALDGLSTSSAVGSAIGLLERCGHQDDFGFFASIGDYVERFGDEEPTKQRLSQSVASAPSWKAIEILPGIVGRDEAVRLLRDLIQTGAFTARDRRYDEQWLTKRLDELLAG